MAVSNAMLFMLKELSNLIAEFMKSDISDKEKETLHYFEMCVQKFTDGVVTPERIIELTVLQLKLNKFQQDRINKLNYLKNRSEENN